MEKGLELTYFVWVEMLTLKGVRGVGGLVYLKYLIIEKTLKELEEKSSNLK